MKLHNKHKFTRDEDRAINILVEIYGSNNWKIIAKDFPDRTARQLRERWKFYLNSQLNKNPFTSEEDQIIIDGQKQYGNSWKTISEKLLPNRTDLSIRNRFRQITKESVKPRESSLHLFDLKLDDLEQSGLSFQNKQFSLS
jgi:myb proto-oncogene protein